MRGTGCAICGGGAGGAVTGRGGGPGGYCGALFTGGVLSGMKRGFGAGATG
jgi:hypothetical protein